MVHDVMHARGAWHMAQRGRRPAHTRPSLTASALVGVCKQAAAERVRRIETFGRQALRRMLHDGVRRGFTAWVEAWEKRTAAKHAVARTARRLRNATMREGLDALAAAVEAAHTSTEIENLRRSEARMRFELEELRRSSAAALEGLEGRLALADEDKAAALHKQLVDLTGTVEEREALLAAEAREERIEIVRRHAVRQGQLRAHGYLPSLPTLPFAPTSQYFTVPL